MATQFTPRIRIDTGGVPGDDFIDVTTPTAPTFRIAFARRDASGIYFKVPGATGRLYEAADDVLAALRDVEHQYPEINHYGFSIYQYVQAKRAVRMWLMGMAQPA